jgi:hypothetical protein
MIRAAAGQARAAAAAFGSTGASLAHKHGLSPAGEAVDAYWRDSGLISAHGGTDHPRHGDQEGALRSRAASGASSPASMEAQLSCEDLQQTVPAWRQAALERVPPLSGLLPIDSSSYLNWAEQQDATLHAAAARSSGSGAAPPRAAGPPRHIEGRPGKRLETSALFTWLLQELAAAHASSSSSSSSSSNNGGGKPTSSTGGSSKPQTVASSGSRGYAQLQQPATARRSTSPAPGRVARSPVPEQQPSSQDLEQVLIRLPRDPQGFIHGKLVRQQQQLLSTCMEQLERCGH